jgi:hypothetical protein
VTCGLGAGPTCQGHGSVVGAWVPWRGIDREATKGLGGAIHPSGVQSPGVTRWCRGVAVALTSFAFLLPLVVVVVPHTCSWRHPMS